MKKAPGALLSAAFLAAIAATALGSVASAQSDTIKIGGGFALTGAESSLDVPAYNGATLAVEEINAAGGINGQQLEMVTHDSQYDMAVTAQTAQQYVEEDKVAGHDRLHGHRLRAGVRPIFQEAGIPFITVGAHVAASSPSQVGDMMFLAAFGDNVQAAAGAEYALENFGDTAYLLWDKGRVHDAPRPSYFKDALHRGRRHASWPRTPTRATPPTSRPRSPSSRRSPSSPPSTTSPPCRTTSASSSSRCATPA